MYLAGAGKADAGTVASALGTRYAVAAMALLRLFRQGLATRERDKVRRVYFYQLSDRGQLRLRYFEQVTGDTEGFRKLD